MSEEQVKGIPERAPEPPYMDFPEAWAFVRTTKLEDHHMRCSWRSGVLCDCNVLWAEYYKRNAARSEQALAELQAQLAASQARVGELEKALQEALMIIEVGLDTGTFELAGSLADIPARCRAALATP